MTHDFLVLHRNRDKQPIYIMADAIDCFDGDKSGSTWICLRGGNEVNVLESPEEICTMLRNQRADTRSEQERWLNGE